MHNMRKYPIIFFAAAAALAACTKTEVIPVENDTLAEITYETAPVTKAPTATQKEFKNTNIFSSVAFYLPESSSWDWADKTKPEVYIGSEDATISGSYDGVTIAYDGKAWRNAAKKYYWPKKGKLTFFAWSLNSANLNISFPSTYGAGVYCIPSQGIVMNYFDIDDNKNIDFMVADVALDKNTNQHEYYTDGVPTLFRHKLSQLYFTVREKEDYSGVKFTLNSIEFKNLADQASYAQHPTESMSALGINFSKSNQTYVTGSTQEVKYSTDGEAVQTNKNSQTIYLPQTFLKSNAGSQVVEITYTVEYTTDVDSDNDGKNDVITETITETKKLCELFPDSTSTGNGKWEMGKKYILNLIFALDEILWDPAVEDWTSVEQTVSIQ